MTRLTLVVASLVALAALTAGPAPRARADEIPQKYRQTVNEGLKWLVEKQILSDDKK